MAVDTMDGIRGGEAPAEGTALRPSRRGVAALAVLALAGSLLAAAAPARADLAPTLTTELLQAAAQQPVTVIVSLAAQVDPALYVGDPVGLLEAQHALAEQTQPAIAAAAGVPVVSLWSVNALALTASAETIERLAAMPGVARVELDPTARIATPTSPQANVQTATQLSQTASPVRPMTITVEPASPLRVLGVVQQRSGTVRSLLIRLALDRPATVRAELRSATRRIAGSSVRRLTGGRFTVVVAVPPQGVGALRLRFTGRNAAGSLLGPAVERAIRIAA